MGRRAVVVLLAMLVLAAPAASDPGSERERLEARIGDLRERLRAAGEQEGVLTSELSTLTARIRAAQAAVDVEQAELAAGERELATRTARREALDRQVRDLRERLSQLRREEAVAVARLELRVREIYMVDEPDPVSFLLGAASFGDLIDTIELLDRIGRQDERIAGSVTRSRVRIATAQRSAVEARREARVVERQIAARLAQQHAIRDSVLASRNALVAAESSKEAALGAIREDRVEFAEQVEVLEEESAALAARIRAAQESTVSSGSSPAPSPGGFAWPVGGSVVSGFGPRGGRLHEGIDIIASTGTPVRASAAGVVIHSGWLGGYGLLVVVDHGGGLSTAYAHNSSLARGVGSRVAQGDVIAYVGSTGNSSGPHVHFEVRVNGTAVDPTGYL